MGLSCSGVRFFVGYLFVVGHVCPTRVGMDRTRPVSALTDVAWVGTTSGPMTVRDVLAQAHALMLDVTSQDAVLVGATLRLLSHLAAVVVRLDPGGVDTGQFSGDAVDAAIDMVGDCALLGGDVGFLHVRGGDALTAQQRSLRRLSPALHPVSALNFWERSTPNPDRLSPEQACRALVAYSAAFPVGNNKRGGVKCRANGPAIYGSAAGGAVTVEAWVAGENLHDTLLMNMPSAWVNEGGLPAWADPLATQGETPLWEASWTPNTVGATWDKGDLVGVTLGGVPFGWLPKRVRDLGQDNTGEAKAALKEFLRERNTSNNPAALWKPPVKSGWRPRLELIMPTTSATPLAVTWLREGYWTLVAERSASMVQPVSSGADLWLTWTQVDGKVAAPSVRATKLLDANQGVWLPDGEVADLLQDFGALITKTVWALTNPFRADTQTDKKKRGTGQIVWSLNAPKTQEQRLQRIVANKFWELTEEPLMRAAQVIVTTGQAPTTAIEAVVMAAAKQAWDTGISLLPNGPIGPRELVRDRTMSSIRKRIRNL